MKKLLLASAAFTLSACGALLAPCPDSAIAPQLDVRVLDPNLAPVSSFEGSIFINQRSAPIACGQLLDGGVGGAAGDVRCEDGGFALFATEDNTQAQVTLRARSGSFDGSVPVVWTHAERGTSQCPNTASSGAATVTLQ